MDARRVEIVSADELSESDTLQNMSDSQMNIELNFEDVQDIILPDRLRQQPLYLNRYTGEWRVSTTRQNATLTTSTSEPDINQTRKNDETKTQDSDMLNQILTLLGDQNRKFDKRFDALDEKNDNLKRDIGKFDTKFDELTRDIKQNFEKQSRQIADLTETTSSLGRKFTDLSDKVTRQEKVFVKFSDEAKTDLQRCNEKLLTVVSEQQKTSTQVDELRQSHNSVKTNQEHLDLTITDLSDRLNDVTLEQKSLQEKLEKLEDRVDVASLKNDTTLAEKLVHECKLCDDYLDEKFETMTQIILDKTKEQVKGETDNIQKEVRKFKENVIPSLSVIPKPITGNQNTNETHNNARPSTQPKIELPLSDTNPNEPFSMLPQDQNYNQTSPHTRHNIPLHYSFLVVDKLDMHCILGIDFLNEYQAIIDLGKGKCHLTVNQQQLTIELTQGKNLNSKQESEYLTKKQQLELLEVLQQFAEVFVEKPGIIRGYTIHTVEHIIIFLGQRNPQF
ncbi:uncharacterized protein LOC126455899 [Schistocerca serialis cubense]|uniref:uncharacterized protein LOC126455899 n=1 Tax=Schistocerca serialis cubense TaxID=2023355 RepID=UPI00214E9ACE|nr:uncharacterized protein LOC126455899 [Schistocerca serialis cubense]